jgi:acetyl esterase/lipase
MEAWRRIGDSGASSVFRTLSPLLTPVLCLLTGACTMVPAPEVKTVCNVVFSRPDWPKPMMAHVDLPRGEGPHPAVLLLHGGGLADSGGRWQMAGIAGRLARRGYVVVNSTYRTVPKYQHPVPLEDVREALRWMRSDAGAAHGIDPLRIAVFGYSAGGYLASLAALTEPEGPTRVKAIVAGGAPSDMIFYAEGDLVPKYLGGRLYDVPKRFYEASPANYVAKSSPPIFLYYGGRDRLVRPEHPLLMADTYRRAGARHEMREIPRLGHISTFLFSTREVDEAIDFLDGVLKR